jgi:hypothetical protein
MMPHGSLLAASEFRAKSSFRIQAFKGTTFMDAMIGSPLAKGRSR